MYWIQDGFNLGRPSSLTMNQGCWEALQPSTSAEPRR